jgi:hypothetical protein
MKIRGNLPRITRKAKQHKFLVEKSGMGTADSAVTRRPVSGGGPVPAGKISQTLEEQPLTPFS